jgi:uncharacterized protein (DUF488 family)
MNFKVWTIGHSTRSIEDFIYLLKSFQIFHLADIRSYPGSKRYPHFNKEALQQSLLQEKIQYSHLPELGGRRKTKPDSLNTAWKHEAFRGYADYMETDGFKKGIEKLEDIARSERIAYMCSEAVWWKCHRALVSDYLKVHGWEVIHIMGEEKAQEHPYTKAAKVEAGELKYN